MMGSQNVVYGSTMSPARLMQIQETVDEYFGTMDHTCLWFQSCLHDIIQQAFPHLSVTSPGVDKVRRWGQQGRR